jgi:hypothetical protein
VRPRAPSPSLPASPNLSLFPDGALEPSRPHPSRPGTATRPPTRPPIDARPPTPSVTVYSAASIPAGRRTPDELYEPRLADEVGHIIDAILVSEAPIHLDLLARRVGAYFGIARVTLRVGERVRELVADRGRYGAGSDADVVWRVDQDASALPTVRTADEAAETKRDVDEIPLSEIAAAAAVVLSRAIGAPLDDLARDTARLLGFARVTDRVARRMRTGIDLLVTRGGCLVDGDRASLP